jgi:hypothetical protein
VYIRSIKVINIIAELQDGSITRYRGKRVFMIDFASYWLGLKHEFEYELNG